jgi:hypothetical protein
LSEIIKVNLVYSYPVAWSRYKVLTDYIQNFYDAIGSENFANDFKYYYNDGTLVMKANKTFGKEWLFYFGASSKRENDCHYAGRFGEGFKVASLIAHRDFGWDITMESDDWKIQVTSMDSKIADKDCKFLAYELDEREKSNMSVLTIKGVEEKTYELFDDALNVFEYKSNPYFGKSIYESENVSIYHLGQDKGKRSGRIYVNYQEREFISPQIVICIRNFNLDKRDDRDRNMLYQSEIKRILRESIIDANLPANVSYELLVELKEYWSIIGANKCEIWTDSILHLITKVALNKKYRDMFINTYGDKLTANIPEGTSKSRANIAREWYRRSDYYSNRKIVSYQFERIGIKSIIQLCEENNGFEVYRKPNEKETKCIEILSEMAKDLIGDIICYETMPRCEIIINKKAPIDAKVSANKISPKKCGMQSPFKVVYQIKKVYLQYFLFDKDRFGMASTSYMHELLHEFGGDSSIWFHNALALMGERILSNKDILDKYEEKWREALC